MYNKSIIWIILILLAPIAVMFIHALCQKLVDYMFSPYNSYNYHHNKSKETQTITPTTTKRRILGRKHPPCATFFSKIDGKETQVDGPYEEKWLTRVEKWNWEIRGKNE